MTYIESKAWGGARTRYVIAGFLAVTILSSAAFPQAIPKGAIEAAGLKRREVPNVSSKDIETFMDMDDPYSDAVLQALPEFARIGRQIFGAKLPSVRFFLMSDAGRYRAFFRAVFGQERMTGTGNLHIVTMCLSCEKRRVEESETTAVVLHEFGHAWLNTYLKEGFGRNYLSGAVRRPYLDEGLADFIADQWDREFLARRGRWIRDFKVRHAVQPPKLEELEKYASFYDLGDRELHYWISALLVRRMIGPEESAAKKIPRYLDLMGRGETPETAWEQATGKSLAAEYDALVREVWGDR
jgi:hypothetical protein